MREIFLSKTIINTVIHLLLLEQNFLKTLNNLDRTKKNREENINKERRNEEEKK